MTSRSGPPAFANGPIPARAGIGLKSQHLPDIADTAPAAAWFEIHAENFMGDGGPTLRVLEEIRRNHPISVHGVGLSIGGSGLIDENHLDRLRRLVERIQPGLVSEHLAWCSADGTYLNDLLPVRYDRNALINAIDHVNQVQDTLGRTILIENPSLYVGFAETDFAEPDFLNEIVARTGCRLLLDVNNVVVSASNLDFDPLHYLVRLNLDFVGEIHLAGHHVRRIGDRTLRIDDHGSPVCEQTWNLYCRVLAQTGPIATLIEWDNDVPALATLLAEAARADQLLQACQASMAS